MGRRAAAWLVVISAVVATLFLTRPPGPGSGDAPAERFSTLRAFAHVEAIGERAHPIGSEANAAVQKYIVDRLSEYGYVPEVQNAETTPPLANVLAFLPGEESTGIIAVVGHYDSVPTGPGAADDGAAVGAMLEVARVLQGGERPANDVLFLFTDGEEAGLLGAQAFVMSHPLARDVKLALNFEARGSGGRSLMFQTSLPNEWLISRYAAASRPAANSIMADVYRRMPHDTDFTVFDLAGVRGLNFAFIEDGTTYHTPEDTPERLSMASLGHHGRNLLEMVTAFGEATLTAPSGGSVVYFDVLGRWLVVYPEWVVWPLTGFALLLFAGLVFVVRRERIATIRGTLGGGAAHLAAIAVSTFVVWIGVKLLMPVLEPRMAGPVRVTDLDPYLHLAFLATTVGIACLVGRFAARRTGIVGAHLGALAVWLLLGIASAAILPGASFAFLVPLLFALVGVGWTLPFVERSPATAALVAAGFAIPGLVIYAPMIREFLAALGSPGTFLVFPLVALSLGLVVPLFSGPSARRASRR